MSFTSYKTDIYVQYPILGCRDSGLRNIFTKKKVRSTFQNWLLHITVEEFVLFRHEIRIEV